MKVSVVLHPLMETKDRILQKTHELFNRYGIRSVSMDDIAAQLAISKKTLYQCYTDKEELVNAVCTAIMDANRIQCIKDQKRSENAVHEIFLAFDMVQQMFANMNPSLLHDLEKYHSPTFKKFQDYKNGFLYQMIRNNLERGVREEAYRSEIDIDVLTRFRIHSIMLAFNPEVFPNNRTNLLHIEQQLLEHFLYGLSTTKGQKLIQRYKSQRTKKIIA
ncbi:MAG: TetR/AcrR family transcriptional regulator [Chitinophagaceae bacterium]|nr:TetR/AcrR family transcriptional regulator [Chitinophagaceae bacterium]